MFDQDGEMVGELHVPHFTTWSESGILVARGVEDIGAVLPAPGWKWNGKEWEYSSRHLNEPHLRAVS